MNSVCEDIKDVLEDNESLGLVFGTNLFIANIPISPTIMAALYDTSSGNPETMLSGDAIQNDSIQVIIRGVVYEDAYALAMAIRDYLVGISNQIYNDTRYLSITHFYGPQQYNGTTDKRGVIELSINFQIKRTKS